tara:strand:+ start:252 stop:470 length:219 start_codon:yes stop_codon:yes gene_type:complete
MIMKIGYTTEYLSREFAKIDKLNRQISNLKKALSMASTDCEDMNHEEKDYHDEDQECPIEIEIAALIESAEE